MFSTYIAPHRTTPDISVYLAFHKIQIQSVRRPTPSLSSRTPCRACLVPNQPLPMLRCGNVSLTPHRTAPHHSTSATTANIYDYQHSPLIHPSTVLKRIFFPPITTGRFRSPPCRTIDALSFHSTTRESDRAHPRHDLDTVPTNYIASPSPPSIRFGRSQVCSVSSSLVRTRKHLNHSTVLACLHAVRRYQ